MLLRRFVIPQLPENRRKHDVSQKEAVSALGITRRALQSYEQGVSYPRDRSTYTKLAELFNVNVNYFLTENDRFLGRNIERWT